MRDEAGSVKLRQPRRGPTRGAARAVQAEVPKPSTTANTAQRPERWVTETAHADIATLRIPASLSARRVFEIDVRLVVRAAIQAKTPPWLALTVEIDGAQQWSRRIDAACPGASDSLDYHCRRELMPGQALRIRALSKLGGAARLALVIEAEQALPS